MKISATCSKYFVIDKVHSSVKETRYQHLEALLEYLKRTILSGVDIFREKLMRSIPVVTFENLWMLFKPGNTSVKLRILSLAVLQGLLRMVLRSRALVVNPCFT